MNLRLLAPDIQEALLSLPRTTKGRDPVQYRHILPITLEPEWSAQRQLWRKLVEQRKRNLTFSTQIQD
jgi:hypothetical protein